MPDQNKKLNILLFWFNDDWGKYGRAYERVAEHLSKLDEVGHLVCMFPPEPSSDGNNNDALHIRTVSENLTIIKQTDKSIFRVNARFSRLRERINKLYKQRALKKKLHQLGFRKDNTILWLFPPHPYLEYLLENIPHCYVVTHVIDDFTKFDPNHSLHGYAKRQYPKLGDWSDTIITTSKANQENFSKVTASCFMFWPAVDESFIGEPRELPHKTNNTHPRLGYVGWIMERTDLELIRFVATKKPEWQIILAGPEYPEGYLTNSSLLELPNIRHLGELPQNEVPAFLWSLDVCLIPHKDTEYSRSMGPLKLYQYLASGKPIVSTEIAGLEYLQEHLYIANNQQEFVNHIEEALKTDTKHRSDVRIQIARQNTWPVRVRDMFGTVLREMN